MPANHEASAPRMILVWYRVILWLMPAGIFASAVSGLYLLAGHFDISTDIWIGLPACLVLVSLIFFGIFETHIGAQIAGRPLSFRRAVIGTVFFFLVQFFAVIPLLGMMLLHLLAPLL